MEKSGKNYQTDYVLHNTKQQANLACMSEFGETLRNLRVAKDLGLRDTANRVGISPAYLSRIERGKERPPRPEIIKELARLLAADPDVLFRLSASTDPEVVDFLHERPDTMGFLRFLKEGGFSEEEIGELQKVAESMRSQGK